MPCGALIYNCSPRPSDSKIPNAAYPEQFVNLSTGSKVCHVWKRPEGVRDVAVASHLFLASAFRCVNPVLLS